jgi:signal transduction histidine kinase
VARIEGAAQDITGRKHLEEELRRRLEQLAEANRRKDEFLALVSHELRNPLAAVRHGLQVMSQLGKDDTPLDKVRAVMERQVGHLSRLVDDLLDASRVTWGTIRLRPERVSLAAVVQEAVEISRPVIEARRHQLSVSLPERLVWLEADRVRLVQVLTNLLHNAAQYTEEGGHIGSNPPP